MRRAAIAAAALGLALSACQVRVATDIRVDADGSGTLDLAVGFDDELQRALTADGFDPFAGIEEVGDGWSSARSEDGREIKVSTTFASAAQLTDRVADLGQGLDEEDPRILRDVTLAVDEAGSATFTAMAGLTLPSSTGAEGTAITFDGDDLAALVQERGDEVVRYDLRVVLPGPVTDSDADEVDGRVVTWHLPVGQMRAISASSVPPADRTVAVAIAVGLLAAAAGAAVTLLMRRRRSTPPSAPDASVPDGAEPDGAEPDGAEPGGAESADQ